MTVNALVGLLVGSLLAAGLVLLVMGWKGQTPTFGTRTATRLTLSDNDKRRAAAAIVGALLVGLITRWPTAALATAAGVWMWPKLFGAKQAGEHELERIEALATWTESLRDTIAGAISLEQAIPATLDAAPPLLYEPLAPLVGMLRARVPLPEALARFAEELDDASADLVVAALILNARLRGPGLAATLSELSVHAREELELRQRMEAGRKTLRRSANIIVGVTLVFAGGLALFARQYVEPYGSPVGQFVLAIVIAIFAIGFMWLRKLAEYQAPARFLASPEEIAQTQILAGGGAR